MERLRELYHMYVLLHGADDTKITLFLANDETTPPGFVPQTTDENSPGLAYVELLVGRDPEVRAIQERRKRAFEEGDDAAYEALTLERDRLRESKRSEYAGRKNWGITVCINRGKKDAVACALRNVLLIGALRVVQIGTEDSDPMAAAAHELIHMKHYLEEATGASTLDTFGQVEDIANLKTSVARRIGQEAASARILPEVADQRDDAAWTELEERRTVCGPDPDGITELAYRIAAKLPNRYLYITDTCFLENFTTYQAIVNAAIDKWNAENPEARLRIDPKSFWPDKKLEEADISRSHTPASIKQSPLPISTTSPPKKAPLCIDAGGHVACGPGS